MSQSFTEHQNSQSDNMTMTFETTTEFSKDLKKLAKKFLSLPSDLETLKKSAIWFFHNTNQDNGSIFQISGVGHTPHLQFYKVKKFACKSLKGRGAQTGLRLIYAYLPAEQKVLLIQLYFKADMANEDQQRIVDFVKKHAE